MIISGIQQIGIGVKSLQESWRWYKDHFGMNIRIFDEEAPANYMLPYTGGVPCKRHAALALNMMGGGGFEIWQYKDREPRAAQFEIKAGDLGIYAGKMKSPDVQKAHKHFNAQGLTINGVSKDPDGREQFFMKDPHGNLFHVVESNEWFMPGKFVTGANYGAVIGCSDMERSIKFYGEILGYDIVVYDEDKVWDDLASLPGGKNKIRRVLLKHSAKNRGGSFSELFGPSEIELLKVTDRKAVSIYKDRYWGELGFIHLCYDIIGMEELKAKCEAMGHPFTVDSSLHTEGEIFDMGEAAGNFSYIDDPDGTLIEFVETQKIPIAKTWGIYLRLDKKKDRTKPVSNNIIKMLRFMKVKEKHLL